YEDALPGPRNPRDAAVRKALSPGRLLNDFRARGIRLPRDPNPPCAHRPSFAQAGPRYRRGRWWRGGRSPEGPVAPSARNGSAGRWRRAQLAYGMSLVAPRPGQDALWAAGQDVQDRPAVHDVHPLVRVPVVDVRVLGFHRRRGGE